MKKLSIVIACYNEAKNIAELHTRITTVMQNMPAYDYEIIFVDNASTDNSHTIFQSLTQTDQHVTALIMSRNFGTSQSSILAGMHHATGDCMISIDGDLQDPPELIPTFVTQWEAGYDVVYGIRTRRKGSIARRIGYTCFYRLFKMLSYIDIPLDAGDTGLISRTIMNIILSLPEKDLYIRGLRAWAGFKQTGIEYTREDRAAGVSSNSFLANFFWAKKAIINFSYKPLEYISRLAAGAVVTTIVAAGVYLYWHFKYGAPRGFSTLLMVMFIIGTIQLLSLAVIGEYLIRIFAEVKGRPPYIIGTVLGQTQPTQTIFYGAQQTPVCSTCKHNNLKDQKESNPQ